MAAAAWTKHAKDISGRRDLWDDYLTAEQLADTINLGIGTILDSITRNPREDDPRSAIARPAAYIGQPRTPSRNGKIKPPSRLNATPMWHPSQGQRYLELKEQARTGRRNERRSDLPVYSLQRAAEEGLASTEELSKELGVAENSIRRWAREEPDFPAELAEAERVPPHQFGPPRVLRSMNAVRAWLLANARLDDEHRARLEADLAGAPAA